MEEGHGSLSQAIVKLPRMEIAPRVDRRARKDDEIEDTEML